MKVYSALPADASSFRPKASVYAPSIRAGESMCGPNNWPDFLAGFRDAVYEYFKAV